MRRSLGLPLTVDNESVALGLAGYDDTHDVVQVLYATGVTLYSRHANYSLTASTGYYQNDIDAQYPTAGRRSQVGVRVRW